VLLTVAITGVVLGIKFILDQTNEATAPGAKVLLRPDASVLSGTFITLYTAFIAGFLALADFVSTRKRHLKLRFIAIWFLAAATGLDLWRVINAADDIYEILVCRHTRADLLDDLHDFWIYFVLNVVIAAFVVIVAVQGRDPANQQAPAGNGPTT
jgi:dipeptide/tripeptide permease